LLTAALTFLLLTLAGPACGPLDADGALALASRNADEMAIKRAELAAAEADLAIARAARFFPSATVTALTSYVPAAHGDVLDATPKSGRTLADLGPFVRVDVNVIQPLFTWGRLDAASAAATAGVKARENLVTDKLSELRVRIAQLYWGETLARRLLGIASDVEKNLAQVNDKLEELLKSGDESVKPADRYRLEVYKGTLRKRKAEAQKGVDLAHGGLAATVGLAPEALTLRQATLPLDPGAAPDAASVRAEAERRRPDVAALDLAISARGAEARAAAAAMKPQLFLGGTFGFAYAPNRTPQLNPFVVDQFNHLGGGVAIGVNQDLAFPLLTAQARKAQAEGETLRRQREGLSRLVAQQVDQALAEVASARERLSAAIAAFGSGRAWFRSAGLDFEAGVGEPKDVLEAYAAFVELQVDQQQAAYDLVVARAKLDQASGVVPHVGADPCPGAAGMR
jgi:outer membrane protein